VLDGGSVAIPGAPLLLFRCPHCAGRAWARLADGEVAVGQERADPGRFEPSSRAADPHLSVRLDAAWLDCWYGGRYRRFPAQPQACRASA
jgi:hypothetical protein